MGVLSDILKDYRQQKNLLQKEVADLLEISREHYAQIEGGCCIPSLKLLQKISERLQLNITVVFDDGKCEFVQFSNEPTSRGHTHS
jgi:transcriptional regulator with XRE-family HTH domain